MLAAQQLMPIADQSIVRGEPSEVLNLSNYFDDSGITGTVVRFDTNTPVAQSAIHVELFDQPGAGRIATTPRTVENFLSYANTGLYDGTIAHFSNEGAAVRAGRYLNPGVRSDVNSSDPTIIPAGQAIPDESGNANIRGTISTFFDDDQNPGDATSQWFFNTGDNPGFDSEGYAVFGRVSAVE